MKYVRQPIGYELLKDLPNCKAGTIFRRWNHAGYRPPNNKDPFYLFTEVEDNPEWFKKIEQNDTIQIQIVDE